MTKIAHLRGPSSNIVAILAMVALISLAWVVPAWGQLSEEDIRTLKKRGEQEGWTFTVGLNEATKYSIDELCGFKVIPDTLGYVPVMPPEVTSTTLPVSFDFRDYLQIRWDCHSQAGCGSCWAFATAGALEGNIRMKDVNYIRLCEQHLVSCNRDGWDCDGGWEAHKYYYSTTDVCGQIGAVDFNDWGYYADDRPCECPLDRQWTLDGWGYVAGARDAYSSVEAIKQALLNYGPIFTAVYTGYSFITYTGGIYNACESEPVDHGVLIVGWDDTQGTNGVWIVRNSWGLGWGEEFGHMRIEYGCSRIGYASSYSIYKSDVPYPWTMTDIRSGESYYQTLQAAYDAASDGAVVQCKAAPLEGGITANKDQVVTFAGGYNDDFSAVTGKTTIMGPITMQSGQLVFQNDILDQNGTTLAATQATQPASESMAKGTGEETLEEDALLPDDFYLNHCYPNPFNPSTTIEFGLPSNSQVRLDIFNILGQKVATLVNKQMAAGHHAVQWNGESTAGGSVSSGIYLYRIQADGFVQSRKMLMLK